MRKINFSPKQWLLFGLFLLLILYFLFQARFLVLGPQITISTPRDGQEVSNPVVTATGQVRNAAWISLNGRQIFTDEDGRWEEKLIVAEGLSIMTVRVRDRFGREKEESVRIIFNN